MEPQEQASIASKLLNAVLLKSFAEVLLVCVVASLAAFSTFSPQLRGAIDVADQTRIAGWVNDPRSSDRSLEVQLFIDGKFVASKLADAPREDLVKAGVTSRPNHGFSFDLMQLGQVNLSPGKHSAQVYAVREAAGESKILLPISTSPVTFP
ncbi:MAG TPA: hypothetical protein PLK30_24765 [Blastocatellia bacterium]|nr:hypothetical protein [Blastocatellia bacterium]